MLRRSSKKSRGPVESVLKKKRKGCGGKDLPKRKVLSVEWKSEGLREGESGESMEEVALIGPGDSESETMCASLTDRSRKFYCIYVFTVQV